MCQLAEAVMRIVARVLEERFDFRATERKQRVDDGLQKQRSARSGCLISRTRQGWENRVDAGESGAVGSSARP